jgi:hypothetical protein
MPIYRLLQNSAFGPEDVERMGIAYERALATYGLVDPPDALAENLAKLIIEIFQTGEKDPEHICEIVLQLTNKDRVTVSLLAG